MKTTVRYEAVNAMLLNEFLKEAPHSSGTKERNCSADCDRAESERESRDEPPCSANGRG